MNPQRFGGAPQHRAAEFLPFYRPILTGVYKSHKGGPGEQIEDQRHEIVSQSRYRERFNADLKAIEHGVEVFAGADDDCVGKAFLVGKKR